jgi:hypothetical protein
MPPAVAVMVTVCAAATRVVRIVKVAVVLPCGTVTEKGADAVKTLLVDR